VILATEPGGGPAVTNDIAGSTAPADARYCLALSGGGYRAALFHLGALRRLNELGVLSRLR
jgi:NTE family protein